MWLIYAVKMLLFSCLCYIRPKAIYKQDTMHKRQRGTHYFQQHCPHECVFTAGCSLAVISMGLIGKNWSRITEKIAVLSAHFSSFFCAVCAWGIIGAREPIDFCSHYLMTMVEFFSEKLETKANEKLKMNIKWNVTEIIATTLQCFCQVF